MNNKDFFNRFVSNIGVAFWVWDMESEKLYFNDSFYELIGQDPETKVPNINWWERILHPEDKEFVMKQIHDFVSGKIDTYNVECRIIKSDGDVLWILNTGKYESDGKDRKVLCGTTQDITKRKLYEEKLKLAMEFADFSIWECDIVTNEVTFEDNYLKSLGYQDSFFDSNVENWLNITHEDDVEEATENLQKCFSGQIPKYDQKTRIRKADGEYIWIRDVGEIVKFDDDGKPLKMIGGRINIDHQEKSKIKLEEYQEKLKLAMDLADFSIWECDVVTGKVTFEDNYIRTLGYDDDFFDSNVENWMSLIHPDDIEESIRNLENCFVGKHKKYDQKTRIKKSNGKYVWIHDIGEVVKYDHDGKPLKMIGGRINIDELENSKQELVKHQEKLEIIIQQRTSDLLRRDTVLLELNQMSQRLMATPQGSDFNDIVYECLNEFSSIGDNARFSIFRHKNVDGKSYCYLASNNKNTYIRDFTLEYVDSIFKDISVSFASGGLFGEKNKDEFYKFIINKFQDMNLDTINYQEEFPFIYDHVSKNKILNIQTSDLSPNELIFTKLQGVQSILVAPISISDEPWGFIVLDYYQEKSFTEDDEKMLSLVGSVLAQAIHKNEFETLAIEAKEHNRLMIDSIPLCCNLWQDGVNISTNDEAVRLFDLENQDEYLEKFHLLSPEYQPCGRKSVDMVPELVQVALEEGYNRFEWVHQKLNGEPIPCEITLVRIPYRDHYYVSGCTRDLREFKALIKDIEETQENLKQAHEEALLSSQAKSNFLANMSHEIRTPMNAISGMTDIIIRDANDSEIKEHASSIKRASDSLLSIINDVLDISKIESGKLDIVEGEYSLSNTLHDVLTIAKNRLEDKNLLFVTNFQHDLPEKIIGDDIRIKQIIVNILNNAIKFTEKGSITFDVKGEFADGKLQLTFSVTDTGMGISEEDVKKLFIEFERVNTTKNRSIEGTGLGLAISKRLCEMMDGYFEVKSELGKGSTFSVTITQRYEDYIPIAKIDKDKTILVFESRELYLNSIKNSCNQLGLKNAKYCCSQSEFNEALYKNKFDFIFTTHMYLTKVRERILQDKLICKIVLLADNDNIKSKYDYTTILLPANSIDISNVINGKSVIDSTKVVMNKFVSPESKILIVDDNLVNLKVAQGLMAPYKFKIETAENGVQAVDKIKNNVYDLVFMDHMMPIMDGIDATIKIRSFDREYFKKLPIIALTANAIVGTREMFINEGMNDFIAKPIKLPALNEILSKWIPIEKQLSPDEVGDNNDFIEAVKQEKISKINIKSVDAKLGVERIGGNIDDYIDILVMFHKDGLKRVVNIASFFETNQFLDYKIEVHAIKSAAASIGGLDLSKKAELLESAVISNDISYVTENTQEFLDSFNDLLENLGECLKGIVLEDDTQKENGSIDLFNEMLPKLSIALDEINLTECDSILDELLKYSWDTSKTESLNKIKESVDGYEFDHAIDIINKII